MKINQMITKQQTKILMKDGLTMKEAESFIWMIGEMKTTFERAMGNPGEFSGMNIAVTSKDIVIQLTKTNP